MDFNNNNEKSDYRESLSENLIGGNNNNDVTEVVNNNNNNNNNQHYDDPEAHHIVVNDVLKGEKQPKLYRDAWAAILFIIHIIIIFYLGIIWGIPALNYTSTTNNTNTSSTQHFGGMLSLCILCSISALIISGCIMAFMERNAKQLIEYSLIFSIISNIIITIYFIIQKNTISIIFSIIFLLIAIWYTISAWRRIPFAAINLETALTAVRANGGIVLVANCITIFVNIIFVSLWLLAYLGVYARYTAKTCNQDEQDNACFSHTNPIIGIFFLLSYYWTTEVGKNVLHVTVSGIVGTWWYAPEDANRFWSPAITDSFIRATTYSFGSICFGSLLTSLLQVLHHLAREARKHGRGNDILLCVIECLVGFFERMVAYFNKWAYVYVGLYGYDYLTAGKKVMDLFMARGWTAIINDDLVLRVLVLMSFVIGILTGAVGLFLAKLHADWVSDFEGSSILAFILPFVIGTSMAYILMGVVASAVDTVIVAFCESPLEFERNHPSLYLQMSTAWGQIYPEEFTGR